VWSQKQIIGLFDSLMRDYPINSFLFWKVPKEKMSEFKFYEFIRDFHEKNQRHNPPADIGGNNGVMAVLDGQQRLTSLYIALKGSYASKIPHRRWNDSSAFPKKRLYLNLLSKSDGEDPEYDFAFLTEGDAKEADDDHHWFRVGDILDLREQYEVNDYLSDAGIMQNPDKERGSLASKTLFRLHKVIHVNRSISYYLEQNTELDKVLNIFIRLNSGGTTLSHSDLLLSFATAQWEHRDAREEITGFVDEINGIGHGFNINRDIILKACLVLCDMRDIRFKVDNFDRTNMLKIESEWDNIMKAIRGAVALVSGFGFSRENITSNNLFIPIAYYLKTIGLPNNFDTSAATAADRRAIKKWFVSSLLKKVFSLEPDGFLKPIRDIIGQCGAEGFPAEKITEHFKRTNRTLLFTEDDFNNLLWKEYGDRDTLVILSVICPWADMRNKFHVDHMFPRSRFTKNHLRSKGISDEHDAEFIDKRDRIGNLQLLEGIPNIEKSDKDFKEWFETDLRGSEERERCLSPTSSDADRCRYLIRELSEFSGST
jgi:uncharacterized protein with ParB-like and HNH nuclease domain